MRWPHAVTRKLRADYTRAHEQWSPVGCGPSEAEGGVVVAGRRSTIARRAEIYLHDEQAVLRPEVGTQTQFKKRKQPRKYAYDDSLSPAMDWDGQNRGREVGEWLLAQIEEAAHLDSPHRFPEPRQCGDLIVDGLDDAITAMKALSAPFLNWAGKAERLSFDVPTVPLFVHERLSTKAILVSRE